MEKKETIIFTLDDREYYTTPTKKFIQRKRYVPRNLKEISSFIPGVVVDVLVHEGQQVHEGQPLLILESMKMANQLKCPVEGKVKTIHVKKGESIAKGVVMITLE